MKDNWLKWRGESEGYDLLQDVCTEKREINLETLRSVLVVAIELPFCLGSRHMAGASINSTTNAVAVVVSESSIVRVFDNGELVSEILPELWLLQRYRLHLTGSYSTRSDNEMTVASKEE